ncbi:MAG: tqsA 1 [Firmicutes bacterium]|nr:tqsA 1 [Bacillota bacterium]
MAKLIMVFRVLIVLGSLYLLSQMTSAYLPVILALVTSFILNPLVNKLTGTRIWPLSITLSRGMSSFIAIIFAGFVFLGVITLIFAPFVREFQSFVTSLPMLALKLQEFAALLEHEANSFNLPANLQSIVDQSMAGIAAYAASVAKAALNVTIGLATKIVELVVVPVLTFYFLRDWQQLRDCALAALPPDSRLSGKRIVDEMSHVISGYIRGQVTLSLIIGGLVFSGMYFLSVDYPLVLGLLATITETIPIIGPLVGAAPAVVLAYLANPALAVKVIVFYIIIHQLENHILVPNIMGHTIDLHPVTVIISLLVSGELFGLVGMLLAVPVVALFKVLLKHIWFHDCESR